MQAYKFFSQFFKGYGYYYLLGIVGLIIINILLLQLPKITGGAIQSLLYHKEGLLTYIGYLVAIAVVVTILKFATRHLLLGSIRRFEFLLRRKLFNHALYVPTSYYEQNGPGKVMALMTNDVTSLRVSLGLGMMLFVDAVFFGILSFFYMVHEISWHLAITTILPLPLLLLLVLTISRRMRKRQREAQNTYSDLTEFAQELFLGMSVIRAFNREMLAYRRFQAVNETNYTRNMGVAILDALLAPLTYVAPFICYAINIYVCGRLILEGKITVGDFVAINGYLILVISPIMGLGSLSAVLQKGFASLDRIRAFLALEEEPKDEDTSELACEAITADHLTFTYPGTKTPVISDLSVTIPAGSFVGIVGAPGSGKSTLFKLLLRLQPVAEGQLFIGDQDVTSIPLSVLRRSIAYVPAQSYILGTTVKDNITFGESSDHQLTMEEATTRAALDVDVEQSLGKKKGSRLKERGADLSGGQKQRINIARGLYKNAPYLLLDDSFSALDTERVAHIIQTLRAERTQTLLFISQRIEALAQADTILVFKEGRIVESGTHDVLMKQDGEYTRLYQAQMKEDTYETENK